MTNLQEWLEQAKELETKRMYSESRGKCLQVVEHIKATETLSAEGYYPSHKTLAEALNLGGIDVRMMGKFEEAREDYKAVLAATPDSTQKSYSLTNIADINRRADKDYRAAHRSLDEALSHAENGSLAHATALDQRGMVFDYMQTDFDSAIGCFERARDICEKLVEKNPEDKDAGKRLALINRNVAYTYMEVKDLGKAYDAHNKALTTFIKIGDIQNIMNCCANGGRLALQEGNPLEAIAQYKKSEAVVAGLAHADDARTNLALHLAEAYLMTDQLDLAKESIQRYCLGVERGDVTASDVSSMKERYEKTLALELAKMPEEAKLGTLAGRFV